MKAILRQVRISPKKVNLVAAIVRNKKVTDAIDLLHFIPKRSAPILKKVISSAMANAENNFKQDRNTLIIKEIIVTEGTTLKRGVPISKGRVHPIKKRTTHITVKLQSTAGDVENAETKKTKKSVSTKKAPRVAKGKATKATLEPTQEVSTEKTDS